MTSTNILFVFLSKMYHFSSDNVCRYMSEFATVDDIEFSTMPIIELFGVKGKVIEELSVYEKIDEELCLKNKLAMKKDLLGSGINVVVNEVCIKNNCNVDYALKIIKVELLRYEYLEFWNEVYIQTHFAFTGYAPRIMAAWTCIHVPSGASLISGKAKDATFLGFIMMEKVNFIRNPYPKDINTHGKRIMEAVKALEDAKIVHNDLHIRNLLITATGKIQIIDFGRSIVYDNNNIMLPRFVGSVSDDTCITEKFHPDTDIYNYIIMWLLKSDKLVLGSKWHLEEYIRQNAVSLTERRHLDIKELNEKMQKIK